MFSRAEFDRRIAHARGAMASVGVDLLFIDSGKLLAWLTGCAVSETMCRAARSACVGGRGRRMARRIGFSGGDGGGGFLASDEAVLMTGQILVIDGGQTL